jgi:RNA polymerase sigma factor (TIGR02999 family)
MVAEGFGEVTRILQRIHEQPSAAEDEADQLFELVYDELRRIAARLMRGERQAHSLQPTALVHEAYLRLAGADPIPWESRAHFLRVAARAMRRILVDHARRRQALKRGGGIRHVTLDEQVPGSPGKHLDIVILDDALTRLGELDERMAHVVELRVFSGMKMEEIAHVLLVSRRTVQDDWDVAKRWLGRELAGT